MQRHTEQPPVFIGVLFISLLSYFAFYLIGLLATLDFGWLPLIGHVALFIGGGLFWGAVAFTCFLLDKRDGR